MSCFRLAVTRLSLVRLPRSPACGAGQVGCEIKADGAPPRGVSICLHIFLSHHGALSAPIPAPPVMRSMCCSVLVRVCTLSRSARTLPSVRTSACRRWMSAAASAATYGGSGSERRQRCQGREVTTACDDGGGAGAGLGSRSDQHCVCHPHRPTAVPPAIHPPPTCVSASTLPTRLPALSSVSSGMICAGRVGGGGAGRGGAGDSRQAGRQAGGRAGGRAGKQAGSKCRTGRGYVSLGNRHCSIRKDFLRPPHPLTHPPSHTPMPTSSLSLTAWLSSGLASVTALRAASSASNTRSTPPRASISRAILVHR